MTSDGPALHVGDPHHPPPYSSTRSAADNVGQSVLRTLGQDVGTNPAEKLHGVSLIEDRAKIHSAHRRDDLGAGELGHHRPCPALQPARRIVTVDADHERAAQRAGRLQQPEVTDVEKVEDTVGKDD